MHKPLATLMAVALLGQVASAQETDTVTPHPYVGMWVTEDGRIRHELLPNNRYVEARGSRERAYEGRYEVTGTHIEYWDDTGFTADGDFIDGVLHHAGMILYRR
ncbi:Atu4866 domain-containing protein [Mesorhizobium sp. CAU 1732]|uniref:Atu4866 domain-containing protein n=1 Tax=Mesorhizobium sp. CAU 1732 TaxID=3140358 RepID=UPI003261B2C2